MLSWWAMDCGENWVMSGVCLWYLGRDADTDAVVVWETYQICVVNFTNAKFDSSSSSEPRGRGLRGL